MERFIPRKRVAIDGRGWWCVWDCVQKCWSSYTCFGKYKTKNERYIYKVARKRMFKMFGVMMGGSEQ